MSVPTIDPESSILSYPQWLPWEHQFSATNMPYDWSITAGAFPTGMTFQPAQSGTASNSGDTIDITGHGYANGTCLVFRTLTGGTGLTVTTTRYYVVNAAADTFQLSLTPGGAVVPVTADYSAVVVYRPGFVSGAASVPGVSTVRLVATNGDGDSAEVLFTIGIEPAAAAPDSNVDLVWDFGTNNLIVQTNATLNLTPAPAETSIIFIKEQDDLIARLRLVKNGTVLDLGDPVALNLRLKELEPENKVVTSDGFDYLGSGSNTSYLLHAKFDGDALAAALSNYENDQGTEFKGLAELELEFTNPYDIGGETLVRTTRTFRIQIDRDLGEN